MKKIFTLLVAAICAMSMWAENYFQVGNVIYKFLEGNNVELHYVPYDTVGHFTIPSAVTYEGVTYNVTSIGDVAFSSCKALTTMTIPSSITRIGEKSFNGCFSLTNIIIPSSVTEIGYRAFEDCYFTKGNFIDNSALKEEGYINYYWATEVDEEVNGLLIKSNEVKRARYSVKHVTIPDGVDMISNYAFRGCEQLTTISIPNTVTWIGYNAFSECKSLVSISIPNSVTNLGEFAFFGCSSLESVSIGSGVKTLQQKMFYSCSSLESVVLGSTVQTIGDEVFADCSSLTSITLPSSVTSIGRYAFQDCSSLESITIPSSVTSIDYNAFYGCYFTADKFINNSSLESYYNWGATIVDADLDGVLISGNSVVEARANITRAVIPDYVTYISDGVFLDKTDLSYVSLGSGLTYLGYQAFMGCTALTSITIPGNIRDVGSGAFQGCTALSTVNICDGVQRILPGAFYGCSLLGSIRIPESVQIIGLAVFGQTALHQNEANWTNDLLVIDNCLLDTKKTMSGEFIVSPDFRVVAMGAFAGCTELTKVVLPSHLTEVSAYMFADCSSLESIVWPANATTIGGDAFSNCTSLKSIEIPEGIIYIESRAFNGCTSLATVIIPNSVRRIYSEAFNACSALTSITIGNGIEYVDSYYPFKGCSGNLTKFVCHTDNQYILNAFPIADNPLLDTVTAPASYFNIAEANWGNMPQNLQYIEVTSGELTADANAFIGNYNKKLKTLNLSATTHTSINEEAYKGWYNLESIYLPDGLTEIPYMALAECISLKTINIPSMVEYIDRRAFENCRKLNEVHFAEDGALTEIGDWAFYNCHNLQDLIVPEGVTKVGDAAFFNCTYLTELTLPSTLISVSDNGFALCAKLQKIHVKATTPPAIQAKTFFDVNRRIPVCVPEEAVDAYKSDLYWQEFDIQGESNAPTAVSDIQYPITNIHKEFRNGQLIILRDGKTYNAMGQEI